LKTDGNFNLDFLLKIENLLKSWDFSATGKEFIGKNTKGKNADQGRQKT